MSTTKRSRSTIPTFFTREIFWVGFTGISTLLLAAVAYFEFRKHNKIAREEKQLNAETFLENLKRDFFTRESRELFSLFQYDQLKFQQIGDSSNPLTIFKTQFSPAYQGYLDSFTVNKKGFYLTNEVDDYLLQHFEDLEKLEQKRIISLADIYQDFGYYISVCSKNDELRKYMGWARKNDTTIYNYTSVLFHKIDSLDEITARGSQ